jgi:serine/threonine-protein kinase
VPSAALNPLSLQPPSGVRPRGSAAELLGDCELIAEIASGGMATVYLGVQRGTGDGEKLVAVKKLLPEHRDNSDYVAMLVDEARVSALARHPFVRDVFEVGTAADGSPFLVMEFLVGEPLSRVAGALARPGERTALELGHIARLGAKVCEGLHAIHELEDDGRPLGLVHRDVTPQNLFLLHDGAVRVADFGIVHGEGRQQQHRGEALRGKLAYMSPEYLGRKPYDRRSDVWALGVVLWELAAGRRLFRRENDVAMLGAILDERIPLPSEVRGGIDAGFDAIVMKALNRNPDERHATAAELATELDAYVTEKRQTDSSRDLGGWLAALLPNSLPTLERWIDSARNARAFEPVASEAPPGLGEDEDTMEVVVPEVSRAI